MRNTDLDWEDQYDYGPNEMVELSINNPKEYQKIMRQNIGSDSEIEEWKENNRREMQKHLSK